MSTKVRCLRKIGDGLTVMKHNTCLMSEGTIATRGSLGSLGRDGPTITDLKVGIDAVPLVPKRETLLVLGS